MAENPEAEFKINERVYIQPVREGQPAPIEGRVISDRGHEIRIVVDKALGFSFYGTVTVPRQKVRKDRRSR